jgi:hypothetical protein
MREAVHVHVHDSEPEPKKCAADGDHGEVVAQGLFVAGREAVGLLGGRVRR